MSRSSECHRWSTAIIGFGKIAAGYTEDPLTAGYYPYATHAQVLDAHPSFDWQAVVDPSEDARRNARENWKIPVTSSTLAELLKTIQPEVLVIATPPEQRAIAIETMTGLRALVVEKPLGVDPGASGTFLERCRGLGVMLQVNLWRRADSLFRMLAGGELEKRIGSVQMAFAVYGNGLHNNGTHLIDLVRMLLGEVVTVQAVAGAAAESAGPIRGDVQFPFVVSLESGISVMFQPLSFSHYRENGLDIWGENGRLSIMLEGLSVSICHRQKSRAMTGEFELASDRPEYLEATVGRALYELYDNLDQALSGAGELCSTGESALRTAQVVESVICSFEQGGRVIPL